MDVTIDTCDLGHTFGVAKDHPRKDGHSRCSHCMAIGIDKYRDKIKSQSARIRELEEALELMCRKHRETHGLDGAYDEEITVAEQALRNAKQEKL